MFPVGSERSGTTSLRLMLDHHPGLSWFTATDSHISGLEHRWIELRYESLMELRRQIEQLRKSEIANRHLK